MKGDVVSRRVRTLALAAVVGLVIAGGASPAEARQGKVPEVVLHTAAGLQGGGTAVSIGVTTACPKGATGQQSYVNVSQGQSTFGNGNYTPTCDGQNHTVNVTVPASQGTYQAGTGHALTFAFVAAGGQSFSGIAENTQLQIVTS